MRYGYGRVSTRDQNPDAQRTALETDGCERIFIDKASGKLARRPELDRMLDQLRRGDSVTITKLDRLGRSLANLIELSGWLRDAGVELVILDQGIDTSTAMGRMFFHILGAVAEFERELMSERTMDGLEEARARGNKGGRKPKMTDRQIADARRMYDEKDGNGRRLHTVQEIADAYGVTRPTIYRHLEKEAEKTREAYTAAAQVRQAALGDVKPIVNGKPGKVSPEWIAAVDAEREAKAAYEPARDAWQAAATE
jgi:DNA invertase Pin-like site-specific DNA recombinase